MSSCQLSAYYNCAQEKQKVVREIRRISRYVPIGYIWQYKIKNQLGYSLVVENVPADWPILTSTTLAIIGPGIDWKSSAIPGSMKELDLLTGQALDHSEDEFDLVEQFDQSHVDNVMHQMNRVQAMLDGLKV